MEFYKLVQRNGYLLEEEQGQSGVSLDKGQLSRIAQLLYSCYQKQDCLPLWFRKYLMAYYVSGETEYVALAEAARLADGPPLDGFASTWLEGEEENRVWIGADGVIENRGPSTEKVKAVLELIIDGFQNGHSGVRIPCEEVEEINPAMNNSQ